MGKVTDSVLGGTKGRTGRIVIANVNGTEISKTRPRLTDKPSTSKQTLVKSRMTIASEFVSGYKSFALKHFGQRTGLSSRYNKATGNVIKAYKLNYAANSIDRENSEILFSKGDLEGLYLNDLTASAALSFELTWDDNTDDEDAFGTDQVYVLYCAEDEHRPRLVRNIATRADGSANVSVMRRYRGKTLDVWVCALDADGERVSLSEYAGTVTVS